MAVGAFTSYDILHKYVGDGTVNFGTHTFKMALFLVAGNADDSAQIVLANLTSQAANGNGYLTGGAALTNVTWTFANAVAKFSGTLPTWLATGGTIVAGVVVIYRSGVVNGVTDALVCHCLLNTTGPADITVTQDFSLVITPDADGIIRLRRAA